VSTQKKNRRRAFKGPNPDIARADVAAAARRRGMKLYLLKKFNAMFGLSRPASGLFDFDGTNPYYHIIILDFEI
jgi:hypothetical protein